MCLFFLFWYITWKVCKTQLFANYLTESWILGFFPQIHCTVFCEEPGKTNGHWSTIWKWANQRYSGQRTGKHCKPVRSTSVSSSLTPMKWRSNISISPAWNHVSESRRAYVMGSLRQPQPGCLVIAILVYAPFMSFSGYNTALNSGRHHQSNKVEAKIASSTNMFLTLAF